ncbi:hypothetical protein ACS0TY_015785 [Phlomoides rotata]
MQNYLTKVWNLSFTHAAGILNIWGGISMILPVFFLFLVDAFLGNFSMLVISSISYSTGIGLVTMSTPPVLANATGTCKKYEHHCVGHTQKVMFYTGMSLIAVGVAGNLVSIKPFLEEQREETDDNAALRDCLKIPFFCLVVIVPIVGAIALPYIKPWSLRFGIPAICTLVAMLLFLSGSFTYEKAEPEGSPITTVCRVFVAAASKNSQSFPADAELLYQGNAGQPQQFPHTRFLRCLEKAAIIPPGTTPEDETNRWKLCSVTEVESAKITLRMVPMWTTFIVCGIVSSVGNTYFIEQASKMNRKLGTWKVPLQILLLLSQWAKKFLFDSLAKRVLKKHKTYGSPIGIVVAMIFSILCCITAARVEISRLKTIRNHGLIDKPDDVIPMRVFWLLFQFFLLAGLDSFFEKSVAAFYDTQSPECMKSYLRFFSRGVSGLGFMCSVLSVYVVGMISEKGGGKNWFQLTLNKSRLDRYYWVLAGLSSVNLVVFVVVATCYRYRDMEASGVDAEGGAAPIGSGEVEDKQCGYCCL